MKDILILGMPRTGKTTLAGKLRRKLFNYDVISCDCIRDMIKDSFPQLGIGRGKAQQNRETLPYCISRLLKYNKKRSNIEVGFIVEGAQILPDDTNRLFKNSIIIFLGYGQKSADEILENIRKNDTIKEYTYKRSDERILKELNNNIIIDKMIQEKCKIYHYLYIDTTENREEKLNKIVEDIIEKVKMEEK